MYFDMHSCQNQYECHTLELTSSGNSYQEELKEEEGVHEQEHKQEEQRDKEQD